MSKAMNYRWKRCYELGRNKHWAIVDGESAKQRRVTCHLLVVNHEWADSLGRPFQDCEMPQRIIALLNADERHFNRTVTKLRRYVAPANGEPFSNEGLRDLQRQCEEAARAGDSSLLEMAAMAIKRLLDEQYDARSAAHWLLPFLVIEPHHLREAVRRWPWLDRHAKDTSPTKSSTP